MKDPSSGKELTPKRLFLIAASSMVGGFFAGLTALRALERIVGDQ